jgi:hypothetical protein
MSTLRPMTPTGTAANTRVRRGLNNPRTNCAGSPYADSPTLTRRLFCANGRHARSTVVNLDRQQPLTRVAHRVFIFSQTNFVTVVALLALPLPSHYSCTVATAVSFNWLLCMAFPLMPGEMPLAAAPSRCWCPMAMQMALYDASGVAVGRGACSAGRPVRLYGILGGAGCLLVVGQAVSLNHARTHRYGLGIPTC